MNKQRREQIKEIVDKLTDCHDRLEEVKYEEEECRDNIPENLQNTSNYQNSEDADEKMDSALDSIQEAIDSLEEIT